MSLSTSPPMTGAPLLLALVLVYPSLTAATDIWQFHLRYGPSPPPADRPPISRDATYDPASLRWQIPVIVGSYLAVVCFIGACLLTFGRRMRRDAQSGRGPRPLEMVKPNTVTLDPSPVSPASSAGMWQKWRSPRMGSFKSAGSPTGHSIVSFDPNVIQTDKLRRQEEMERIYDELMAQDSKPKAVNVQENDITDESNTGGVYYGHTRSLSTSSRSFSRRHPPQSPEAQQSSYPAHSPPSTGGVQSIYPRPMSSGPAAPITGPSYTMYNQNQRRGPPQAPPPPTRPLSPQSPNQRPPAYSHSRQASNSSNKSRTSRTSVRNLRISNPIPIPTMQDELDDMKTPLSPRFAREPRPPTPPMSATRHTYIEDSSDSDRDYAVTPGARSARNPPAYRNGEHPAPSEAAYADDDTETEGIINSYTLRTPRPLPQSDPQRRPFRRQTPPNITNTTNPNTSTTSLSRTTAPTPLTLTTHPAPVGSSTNTLPFRAILPPPPHSPHAISPLANQPTFLTPRQDQFLPGGMHQMGPHGIVPNSATLLSAGLATPYSPYMPFSPMTPVTPHLTTRRERREMQRERGRVAVTEEDGVVDEGDMWGDGYR